MAVGSTILVGIHPPVKRTVDLRRYSVTHLLVHVGVLTKMETKYLEQDRGVM